jgi:hypothetical protein
MYFLQRSLHGTVAGGALSRPSPAGVRVATVHEAVWGVSDPHFAAPFFALRPVRRGSLTPHLRVSIVRSNCMQPLSFVERAAVYFSPTVRINEPVRFRREPAFIRVSAHSL